MISIPLLKQSIRSNGVMWGAITLVMSVLCAQFAAIEMTQNLLFVIFYGMMTTILPGIYVLVTANKLLASQVDRGSMAYVLSTPIKRSTVVITQMIYMTVSLIAMFVIQTLIHIAVNAASPISMATALGGLTGMGGADAAGNLTASLIMQINIACFLISLAMAAVCFMFSAIFNSTKYSIGSSGVFIGVTILANMMALFGNLGIKGLDKFKYLTICSFYNQESILLGNSDWIKDMIFPVVIIAGAFLLGSIVFKKKDLPL